MVEQTSQPLQQIILHVIGLDGYVKVMWKTPEGKKTREGGEKLSRTVWEKHVEKHHTATLLTYL